MNINKSSSYVLAHLFNGFDSAPKISQIMPEVDVRSIQRSLIRLTELGLITRHGINSPTYTLNYPAILQAEISGKLLEDEKRPEAHSNHNFFTWLVSSVEDIDTLFSGIRYENNTSKPYSKISARELEYLTVELSWKSSLLEGNTYTLLDTQLLLLEGIKAKNKTDFETQMILNHKNAISFIVEHPDLFTDTINFSTVEQLHKIISSNLGIDPGVRKKLVRITASQYIPLSNPHQLKEAMDTVLKAISTAKSPYSKALLALTLVPYIQLFEDGNKRTGRMLANAILIHTIGKGFSLRKVDAKQLALAYLSFYEFNSMRELDKILKTELNIKPLQPLV
jgi:Fic family protein